MSALDILEKLEGIETASLKPLQRVLIISDGTLTEILEAHFLERIELIKISQQTVSANAVNKQLNCNQGEALLERKIILQGKQSLRNYVYAQSTIALNRLPTTFRDALMNSDSSLGRLWLEHKLETFKELLDVQTKPANKLSVYFNCKSSDILLTRTYRVFSGTVPIMVILECFPVEYPSQP